MRDLTRYEKELAKELKNLPLPGEDASWEDMSKLLDDNDDKIAPPVSYRRNIVLGSVIGILLAGLIWGTANKYSSTHNKKIETNQQVVNRKNDNNQHTDQKQLTTINGVSNKEIITPNKEQTTTINQANSAEQSTNNNNTATGTQTNNNKNEKSLNSVRQTTNNKDVKTVLENNNTNKKPLNNNNQGTNKQVINSSQLNGPEKSTDDKDTKVVQENNYHDKKQSTIVNAKSKTKKTNTSTSQHDQEDNKDELTTINETNNNKADQNSNSKNIHHKKTSNNTIKNRTGSSKDNDVADVNNNKSLNNPENSSISPLTANGPSTSNKAKHNIVTTKSNTKRPSQKSNKVLNDNSTTANANNLATTTPSQSENSNTINTAADKETNNKALANHTHSTVAVYNKNYKQRSKKKNNIIVSTKSRTKSNITASTQTEDNEEALDTTQLIKIGQYVLANKKAKHPVIKKDSGIVKPLVVQVKDSSVTAKKKDGNKKHLSISVGIAEQQAIRLTCDCVYPNDAYTKSSLGTDYIPAVYVRIQPSKKWFVQAELKYKAPQYIQEQLYKKNEQDLPLDYTTTSYVLKKVYYNQIPVSFDYYIIPHLSVGVGVIYNNYAGQVSQEDVRKKLYGTSADSTISSRIISNKGDSNYIHFTKNSFQGLVEGQYDWKRFSIGVRYAIGLQPYIKYNTSAIINGAQGATVPPPSNNIIEKKNDALTIFIRFELWDSKNKKKK